MNFGGAIFYKINNNFTNNTLINNEITFNKAEIMGGGIYTANSNYQLLFDFKNTIIKNNMINSYYNDYASKPSYLVLNTKINNNVYNITSGDYFPLNFTLYDGFDNPFIDYTKYYSSSSLKVLLVDINYDNNFESDGIILKENVGSFINGKKKYKLKNMYH